MGIDDKRFTGQGREKLVAMIENLEYELKNVKQTYLQLSPLLERLEKSRKKYPEGCTHLSLIDECGEFAHAINKNESLERVKEEALDTASVAMRIYFDEWDYEKVVIGGEKKAGIIRELQNEIDNLKKGIGLDGIYLKGWKCACGIFNGEEKERRSECRSCGLARK